MFLDNRLIEESYQREMMEKDDEPSRPPRKRRTHLNEPGNIKHGY